MADEQPTITLDEAGDLLDKLMQEQEAAKDSEAVKLEQKKKKVADLIKQGAKQGRGGLNIGVSRQLEQIE